MKIVFIGAGSYVFTRRLIGDVLLEPDLEGAVFSLVDVDQEKLQLMYEIVQRMIKENHASAQVEVPESRREALAGADIVVTTIRVGSLDEIRADHAVPAEFGMRQTVADTVGPGGVFYGIRNISVLQEICKEMEEVCPDALLLNYTNPMAIAMAVLQRTSSIRSIGLCHSVQHTVGQLCKILDVPVDEVAFQSAGVNHTAWLVKFAHNGTDLYPRLHELAKDPAVFEKDPVRFDLMQRFHYFPTESSRHHAEYHPYYLRWDEECERLGLSYNYGVERYTKEVFETQRRQALLEFAKRKDIAKLSRSVEYFVRIAKARLLDQPTKVYGSVLNDRWIDNLPPECAVEVPVYVDRNGFHPAHVGSIPGGAGARTAAVAYHQALAAEGMIRKDLRLIREAVLCDPNASSSLPVRALEGMVSRLIEVNARYLDDYKDSSLSR